MTKFIQNYRVLFIITSFGLTLLGLATMNPKGFVAFAIPGILLGVLIYFTAPKKNTSPDVSARAQDGLADELLKWHKLKETGAISDDEFEAKKKNLLG